MENRTESSGVSREGNGFVCILIEAELLNRISMTIKKSKRKAGMEGTTNDQRRREIGYRG